MNAHNHQCYRKMNLKHGKQSRDKGEWVERFTNVTKNYSLQFVSLPCFKILTVRQTVAKF